MKQERIIVYKNMKTQYEKTIFPILFGFFVMGFVDVVGISTNYVKADFGLTDTLANLIPMMVFLWFAVFSVPTGILMDKIGRRNTVALAMVVTVAAMAVPLLVYDFGWILAAFALLGIGNTILQVSLNPMVAAVVAPGRITSVLTLGQFIKAISSFLGPVIAGLAVTWTGNWKLIFMAYLLTTLLSLTWLLCTVPGNKGQTETKASFSSTLSLLGDGRIGMLFLGILFIVGIDVGLNISIPKLLMEQTGMPLSEAGLGTSLYFVARTAGTFAGAFLLVRFAAARFLRLSMVVAVAALAVLLLTQTPWVMYAMIVVTGIACANVFPILFSFALQHKPERDNEISALMIMGVSGGALVTPLIGIVSDHFNQSAGLATLFLCMFYIGFIAFRFNK